MGLAENIAKFYTPTLFPHPKLPFRQFSLLPFRYIVECNPDVRPPAYFMEGERTYDLTCIAADGHTSRVKPFIPLNPTSWPTEEQLGLDKSQLEALNLALTKELAIIQGPPGTGRSTISGSLI